MSAVSKIFALFAVAGLALLIGAGDRPAAAAASKKLAVTVESIKKGASIPAEYAFCVPAAQGHVGLGPNKSPAIKWSAGPTGTKSYAIIASDPDAPSVGDDVNKEGKTIPRSLKRVVFYHWVLVDLPASTTSLGTGADSDAVTPHGKPPGPAKIGVRGINDYTDWFANDPSMKGDYGGYDGPCPPWNDAIAHHYRFTVYALDVPSLGLSGKFGAKDALATIAKHTLAKGEVVGMYSLNPSVKKKKPSVS